MVVLNQFFYDTIKFERGVFMPELAEVETVKEVLKGKVLGKTIAKVAVYWPNIVEHPSLELFEKELINETIQDMKRRGKWILFELDHYYLLSHLRMEGKYLFRTEKDPIGKHEHVVFTFQDGTEMRYHDTRKFGKMHLLKKDELGKTGPLVELGYEPWDEQLTSSYLKEKYKTKQLPIKSVLLDQTILVGLGNIYADEVLFLSKINPVTKCCDLTKKDLVNIIENTKIVLEKAIKAGGTTIRTYTSSEGVHGMFVNELNIHGKEKQPCPICGTIITKTRVGGRGTYFCSKCQKR